MKFIEDIFMKIFIPKFINLIFEFFDIRELGNVIKELPTELRMNLKEYRLDYVCETDREIIVNLEFQSSYIGRINIIRFTIYAFLIYIKYQKTVMTIVISSYEKENKIIEHNFGIMGKYKIQVISLKNFDGWKILNNLKKKVDNNEKFNRNDIILLVLLPFMENKIHAEKMLQEAIKISNEMNSIEEEKYIVNGCIIHLIERFIKEEKIKNQLKEGMNMGEHFIYKFFEPDIDEKIGKRIEDGIEEGLEKIKIETINEAIKENNINIAKKMLDLNMDSEIINNLTGIDVNSL